MKPRHTAAGFLLLEAVAAVAVASVAVIAYLAFAPVAARDAARCHDRAIALGLADAVRAAAGETIQAGDFATFSSLHLAASRDGAVVGTIDALGSDGYFAVELDRDGAPGETSFLRLVARVSWPTRNAATNEPVPDAQRDHGTFPLVLEP